MPTIRTIGQRSDEWHRNNEQAGLTEYLIEVGSMEQGICLSTRIWGENPDDAVARFKQSFGHGSNGGIEIGDEEDDDVTYAQLYLFDAAITVRNITEVGDEGFDAEAHLPRQKPFVLFCPQCGHGRLAFVESVLGRCGLQSGEHHGTDGEDERSITGVLVDECGLAPYDGEGTEVNWDTGDPVRDAAGSVKVACRDCDHEWHEPRVRGGM